MNNKELTELKREFAEVLDDAFEDKSYLVDKPQMIEEDALFEQVLDRAWEWVGQKLTQSNDEIRREAEYRTTYAPILEKSAVHRFIEDLDDRTIYDKEELLGIWAETYLTQQSLDKGDTK